MAGFAGVWSRTSKRTGETRSRRWHFGIQARPQLWPHLVYCVTAHVVFSDDGKTLWTDSGKMHRARRNRCKDWYNERWRDRLLAAASFLAAESDRIQLPVSETESIVVGVQPMRFQSKITFEMVKENLEAFPESARCISVDSRSSTIFR
jgi:hypothetical protein